MSEHVFSREACHSILTFLSDIFDLEKSVNEEQFKRIRDNVIIPRGATITRILISSLAGALPSSRLDTVNLGIYLSSTYCIETDVFVAFETPFHLFMNVGFGLGNICAASSDQNIRFTSSGLG